MESVLRYPDVITVITDDGESVPVRGAEAVSFKDVKVSFALSESGLTVSLGAEKTPVKYLLCRWNFDLTGGRKGLKLSGDAWERGYGDFEWRGIVPERVMPWYFLISDNRETAAYGVRVRPNAFCFWQADKSGVTLTLDVRCGGNGVHLNGRTLEAATVLYQKTKRVSAFEAQKRFCAAMCADPLLPPRPLYGSNNWYYAYGQSSHGDVVKDAEYLSELTKGISNRPFMVIDDCWQALRDYKEGYIGGPWDRGNDKFPDMAGLAGEISARGAEPGIWARFLSDDGPKVTDRMRLSRCRDFLDPSVPDTLEYVAYSVRTVTGWGYKLIKHDYSTYDMFGRWGKDMVPTVTRDSWSFADTSKTSAEIVKALYKTILDSAGDALILGCNCIGHLGAGLMYAQRIGDDTSGADWERTRKFGVNTLAFRLAQNGSFFASDADCVGAMGPIPWSLNRKWAGLLAKSGTPMFVSAKPGLLTGDENAELSEFFRINALQKDVCEPLDWMDNACPAEWRINGKKQSIDWFKEDGVKPL